MAWGPIISMGMRRLGNLFLNRMDPDRVNFWDLRKLRKANRKETNEFRKAVQDRNTIGINNVLGQL